MTIIAGVDEAGRGSVLGPLFIAGVAVEESEIPKLKEIGVKDSKLLLPRKRRKLYAEIRKLKVQVAWEKIDPERIDEVVIRGIRLMRLNYLEAQHMARVLSQLRFDLAYVDCCDTVQERYGYLVADLLLETMQRKNGKSVSLGEENPYRKKIVSEHHADVNHAVVSAASIVAKVRRDAYISLLHRKHGLFGSGYPSDPNTKKYLKMYAERSETLPSITRFSWTTIKNLYQPIEEKTSLIDDFSSGA